MRKNGFNQLVGLTREKRKATIDIMACRNTHETFPHSLLHGVGK